MNPFNANAFRKVLLEQPNTARFAELDDNKMG